MTTYLLLSIGAGLYTSAIFAAGWWLGSLNSRGKLDEKIEAAIERTKPKPKPPTESGPIKPMTQEEYEAERQIPFKTRMAEILGIKKP